jgi:hypothetical protein
VSHECGLAYNRLFARKTCAPALAAASIRQSCAGVLHTEAYRDNSVDHSRRSSKIRSSFSDGRRGVTDLVDGLLKLFLRYAERMSPVPDGSKPGTPCPKQVLAR